MAVALILVLARLYTRSRRQRSGLSFGYDDWFLILGTLFAIAMVSLQVVMAKRAGVGRHIYDTSYPELFLALRLIYVHVIIYYVALTLIKTSILLYLYRLTPASAKLYRRTIVAFTAALWCYMVVCIFVSTFECKPARATFDLTVRAAGSSCKSLSMSMLAINAILVVSDFLLVILPVKLIGELNLPMQQRIGVSLLFIIGLLVCAGNILKLISLNKAYNSFDFSFNAVNALIWAQVEAAFALIAVSLPALSSLFAKILPDSWEQPSMPTTKSSRMSKMLLSRSSEKAPMSSQEDDGNLDKFLDPPANAISSEPAPQYTPPKVAKQYSSFSEYLAMRRELSKSYDPSIRAAFDGQRIGSIDERPRGRIRSRSPSTAEEALRNIWVDSPPASEYGDAEDARSDTEVDRRRGAITKRRHKRSSSHNSFLQRITPNFSVPNHRRTYDEERAAAHHVVIQGASPEVGDRIERSTSRAGSRGASRAGERIRDSSLWPLSLQRSSSRANEQRETSHVGPGIMKTSEFRIEHDDDLSKGESDENEAAAVAGTGGAGPSGILKTSEVHVTYRPSSAVAEDRGGDESERDLYEDAYSEPYSDTDTYAQDADFNDVPLPPTPAPASHLPYPHQLAPNRIYRTTEVRIERDPPSESDPSFRNRGRDDIDDATLSDAAVTVPSYYQQEIAEAASRPLPMSRQRNHRPSSPFRSHRRRRSSKVPNRNNDDDEFSSDEEEDSGHRETESDLATRPPPSPPPPSDAPPSYVPPSYAPPGYRPSPYDNNNNTREARSRASAAEHVTRNGSGESVTIGLETTPRPDLGVGSSSNGARAGADGEAHRATADAATASSGASIQPPRLGAENISLSESDASGMVSAFQAAQSTLRSKRERR
jgi:hypothetical protein